MAKKKTVEDDGAIEILPGTEEFAAREHFAREKAFYEERTGETVTYELAHPITQTPLAAKVESGELGVESEEQPAAEPGGEG